MIRAWRRLKLSKAEVRRLRRLLHGVRARLIRLLLPTDPQPIDPSIGADGGNGFGARKLLRSNLAAGSGPETPSASACLAGVQLLTRFCAVEQPYWPSFLEHYHQLGVRRVHVCVQNAMDEALVQVLPTPTSLALHVHRLDSQLTPGHAWKHLDLAPLAALAPFTMLVDCDEYVQPMRAGVSVAQLFSVFPQAAQLYLPWMMRPVLQPDDHQCGGYWGHVGKPIVRSELMTAIASDHSFKVGHADPRFASMPVGLFGLALVHYWSRSFRDCLLKTFQNRFDDAKSADRAMALPLIRAGELPIRLRLLAYLMLQQGYLPTPASPLMSMDHAAEERLLRAQLSDREEEQCRQLFEDYCSLLRARLDDYPLYPAVTLLQMARLLPPLAVLRSAR